MILSVILYFALSAYFFYLKSYIAAGITLLFSIIYTFAVYTWRHRIPFATVMLEVVVGITRKYPGTVVTALGGLIFQVAYAVLFALTAAGTNYLFNSGGQVSCKITSSGREVCTKNVPATAYVLFVYALFSFYWTTQVIQNVVHVTVSGVFAVYYFLFGTPQMPSGSPTLGSLKRATTTSFGSICFGSLLIAIIQLLKALVRMLMEQEDGILAFVACILVCILGCIEGLVEYFNHYAFTQVAIYGKPFCQAGKDTWTLIKERGIEAVINDSLIGNVLGVGVLLVGVLNALIGYIYVAVVAPNILSDAPTAVILLLVCFFVGLSFMSLVTSVIESGTSTTFVTLAEDPGVLQRNQPQLFERIRQTWPEVVSGIHS